MGQVLVIYDDEGYILSKSEGQPSPRTPIGVPFLWVDMPEKKQLKSVGEIGVNVSVTPNVAILDDVKPSEIEILHTKIAQQEDALIELATIISGVVVR